ncbi:jerky protein homolog [Octopus bimaculoides]|uniref:jerky protein homolog n=1 Tax=Octopus bimaculoides TaxID=37653 RepID=UPI00071C857C|nr:jerky protein homolog [Octopus bimaculoides]|eukprot:XP_014774435.1 PREDICTED: jerky protein homolog-like [Octopus bimaculoides]
MASKKDASVGCGVKRKHQSISIKDKVELLQKLESGVSIRKLCNMYGIGSSTVYDIKKQREKLFKFYIDSGCKKQMGVRKTMKGVKSIEHDRAMKDWIQKRRLHGEELTSNMLMEQAKIFHRQLNLDYECDYSEGWLQRFKRRQGISLQKLSTDKRFAKEGTVEYIQEFSKFITREYLTPEQVYNADETVLYWRCIPKGVLTREDKEGFERSREIITILGCSNAAGTHRCKPLVVGKSKCSKALKDTKEYPIIYRTNKNGNITTAITLEWLEKYFVPEARAHCTSVGLPEDCKILLILDNCSTHPKAELSQKNVFTLYLPPNCASHIQPQEQGILDCLKTEYRLLFMRHILDVVNTGMPLEKFMAEFKIDDLLYYIANAWQNLTTSILKAGWHKLWPKLMHDNPIEEKFGYNWTGFHLQKEKEVVDELLDYAENITGDDAKCLADKLNNENLSEWLSIDEISPIVYHNAGPDVVGVSLISGSNSGVEECKDKNEIDERFSIEKIIDLLAEVITGLEQRNFMSKQELMSLYLIYEKLHVEKSKQL